MSTITQQQTAKEPLHLTTTPLMQQQKHRQDNQTKQTLQQHGSFLLAFDKFQLQVLYPQVHVILIYFKFMFQTLKLILNSYLSSIQCPFFRMQSQVKLKQLSFVPWTVNLRINPIKGIALNLTMDLKKLKKKRKSYLEP